MSRRLRQLRRTLIVLQTLSDGQLHGLEDLANLTGHSPRTIRRDLDALDEAGFAVETEQVAVGSPAVNRTHYQLVNVRPACRTIELMTGSSPERLNA